MQVMLPLPAVKPWIAHHVSKSNACNQSTKVRHIR
jgi:hypothetical protein